MLGNLPVGTPTSVIAPPRPFSSLPSFFLQREEPSCSTSDTKSACWLVVSISFFFYFLSSGLLFLKGGHWTVYCSTSSCMYIPLTERYSSVLRRKEANPLSPPPLPCSFLPPSLLLSNQLSSQEATTSLDLSHLPVTVRALLFSHHFPNEVSSTNSTTVVLQYRQVSTIDLDRCDTLSLSTRYIVKSRCSDHF